jgi:hypothetical protein
MTFQPDFCGSWATNRKPHLKVDPQLIEKTQPDWQKMDASASVA